VSPSVSAVAMSERIINGETIQSFERRRDPGLSSELNGRGC
jgi:hypothetical protein